MSNFGRVGRVVYESDIDPRYTVTELFGSLHIVIPDDEHPNALVGFMIEHRGSNLDWLEESLQWLHTIDQILALPEKLAPC